MPKLERIREELEELLPQSSWVKNQSIAVLLPCYNEETAIAGVIKDFRKALPSARIFVYDNNSTDGTAQAASKAGATVRTEIHQGKGNVVRRMLADIDADIYVLADGDATYDTSAAGRLIDALVTGNLDMVVGTRSGGGAEAYRRGHQWGNRFFNRVVEHLFGDGFSDILSGYRVLSRRFAKSFPVTSSGFEIETELCVHALDLKIATAEIELPYGARPEGSESKLRTYRDGARILWTIAMLYKELKPLSFFGAGGIALMFVSLGLGAPLIATFLETGLVPRLPTAILATGIMQLGFLSMGCGLVLESVAQGRREAKRMRYLDLRSVAARA
ncbi:undecaprenyl-phosphate mannosyltransferase [bacterium BMS3Bbin10]|nr:undecaprenyl-phosphate mannosyltransferase [bacterium BMS3Bbin10]